MTVYYDREYPVNKWIIANDLNEKQLDVFLKSAAKRNVVVFPWPSLEMQPELKRLAGEGYFEYVNQPMPFFLELTLALRAMVNITRKVNPMAQISPSPRYQHLVKNKIETEADFVRIGNEILAANDPITLAQVFDLAEKTHLTFLSLNADKKTIIKVAKEVVVIGNGEDFDINLTNMNLKDLQITANNVFE